MKKKNNQDDPNELPFESSMNWSLVETLLSSQHVRTAYLFGPPGLGKTYAAYHYGRNGKEPCALTLTEDSPGLELRGYWEPRGSHVVWRDGLLVEAMRSGRRLVLNELTHASPDAMSFLHPVLESLETARLTLPTGETVRPAPGFHVVATDNLPPEELPEALRDRFDCVVEIKEPHPDALAKLDADLRRAAQRTANLEPERRVSLRQWLSVQRLRADLGLEQACTAVFGPERGARIHEAIRLGGQL